MLLYQGSLKFAGNVVAIRPGWHGGPDIIRWASPSYYVYSQAWFSYVSDVYILVCPD